MARLAFFDLDRTLLSVNSAALWLRCERSGGRITWFQALRASAWIAQYHLGFTAAEAALGKAIEMIKGTSARELEAQTEAFYREHVRQRYRPGAKTCLEAHRAAGDRLVLLTSSSQYLSDLVREDLRLDGVLCTRFEVSPSGVHTGKVEGPICFGAGKLAHAEAYARDAGLPLEEGAFYTDSYSDLPVLNRVAEPVAVNPDQRLRRFASRHGWKIVDWGE